MSISITSEIIKQYQEERPNRKCYFGPVSDMLGLSNHKWYRKKLGGKWEAWYIGICMCRIWFQVEYFSDVREPCSIGLPIREDYTKLGEYCVRTILSKVK